MNTLQTFIFHRPDPNRTRAMRRKGKGTELRDQTLKSNARKLAHKTFIKDCAAQGLEIDTSVISFDPITTAAIDASHLWTEAVLYPWDSIPDWKCKDAKGFDLAIWYAQKLCGLCYATPRRSTVCIKVILLQGHPDKTHPLRGWIAQMALLAAEFYARTLGCKEIEIQDPDPNVVSYYQELGFNFDETDRLVIYVDAQQHQLMIQTHEVSMNQKKRKAKLLLVYEFHAEALRLAGNVSANQRRFLEVGAARGKELEPAGLLAGVRI